MKITSLLYILPTMLALFTFSGQFDMTFAQSNCLTIFNGGQTTRQVCINPPQKMSNTSNTPAQTKSSLRIYSASNTKSTPSTGPEDWALPSLLLLGGAGFFLIKKTNLT